MEAHWADEKPPVPIPFWEMGDYPRRPAFLLVEKFTVG